MLIWRLFWLFLTTFLLTATAFPALERRSGGGPQIGDCREDPPLFRTCYQCGKIIGDVRYLTRCCGRDPVMYDFCVRLILWMGSSWRMFKCQIRWLITGSHKVSKSRDWVVNDSITLKSDRRQCYRDTCQLSELLHKCKSRCLETLRDLTDVSTERGHWTTWTTSQYEEGLSRYGIPSYLYNGNSFTGKTTSLYWDAPWFHMKGRALFPQFRSRTF